MGFGVQRLCPRPSAKGPAAQFKDDTKGAHSSARVQNVSVDIGISQVHTTHQRYDGDVQHMQRDHQREIDAQHILTDL